MTRPLPTSSPSSRAQLLAGVAGWALALGLGSGCGGAPEPVASPHELSAVDQLLRGSMALRGLRPSPAEVERVTRDPAAVPELLRSYTETEAFAEVLADMHAQQLMLRANGIPKLVLPQRGPLEGIALGESQEAEQEWPLQLVRHVARNDLPYTEVVTADYTFSSDIISRAYGLPYDPTDPAEWQQVDWHDGRPGAGLLSETTLWRRHVSNGANFNRLRADIIADRLLCDPIGGRDVTIEGSIAVSDPDEVALAVSTQPECIACHQALDPLGGFLWGFKPQISKSAIQLAYDHDCGDEPIPSWQYTGDVADYCYPLKTYNPEWEADWAGWGLRAPNYYGQPASYLDELGQMVADDPRFATCTVRRFYSWFAQVDVDEVPYDVVEPLAADLVASGWSTRELAVAIVRRPEFRRSDDAGLGLLATRPEQYARALTELTGYRWIGAVDAGNCDLCWGEVDLARSALHGYRNVAGGTDDDNIIRPTHTTTPMKWLALSVFAQDAAGHAVAEAIAGRSPFPGFDPTLRDESATRAQLADLHLRVLSAPVTADSPEVDALVELVESSSDPTTGWTTALTALFLDPRMLLH